MGDEKEIDNRKETRQERKMGQENGKMVPRPITPPPQRPLLERPLHRILGQHAPDGGFARCPAACEERLPARGEAREERQVVRFEAVGGEQVDAVDGGCGGWDAGVLGFHSVFFLVFFLVFGFWSLVGGKQGGRGGGVWIRGVGRLAWMFF